MSLKKKAISGAKWAGLSQILNQVFQLAIGIKLAQLLSPDDFGLVGMVFVFSKFVQVLSNLGIGAAIIQKKETNDAELSSAFWFNLVFGLGLSASLILAAPLVVRFFDEPKLLNITRVSAVTFFIGSFYIVHVSLLVRNFQFRNLAIVESTSFIVAGIVAIIAAMKGCGVWSLVIQDVVLVILKSILATVVSKWRPRFLFDWSALKNLFPYSLNLSGSQLINYWIRNADNLLIGKFLGSGDLGLYSRAYNFMLMPVRQISAVVSRVMFPALSTIQNDVPRVKSIYLRTIGVIALTTFPAGLGLMAISEHFVLGLLGPQWEGMIPILRVLCLLSLTQSVGTLSGTIFQALGRTDLQLKWTIYASIIYLSAFIVGLQWGALGVAIAYTGVSLTFITIPNVLVVGRLLDMTFSEFAKSITSVLGCSVSMALMVHIAGRALQPLMGQKALFFVLVLAGVAIYVTLIILFRIKAFLEAKALVRDRLSNPSIAPVENS